MDDANSSGPNQTTRMGPGVPDLKASEPSGTATSGAEFRLADRRRAPRVSVVMAGKVFRRSTQQYVPAESRDVSGGVGDAGRGGVGMSASNDGGALLEVQTQRGFQIGEIVDVALAMAPGAVVSATAMISAVVVRARTIDAARQVVAVRYVRTEAGAMRRAA